MNAKNKLVLLIAVTVLSVVTLLFIPPISQDLSYHDFADGNAFFSISNFYNVVSNFPFLIVGIWGLIGLRSSNSNWHWKVILYSLTIGIVLTGLGSAYYHFEPNNYTLVWDRIPMTVVFMSFLCAVIYDRISESIGYRLLFPLLILGIISVLYWIITENTGKGDLRFYAFIQFYPMIIIPIIMFLYSKNNDNLNLLVWVILFYTLAKLFEHFDSQIFEMLPMSGHSLKHLAAAFSTLFIVLYVKTKKG